MIERIQLRRSDVLATRGREEATAVVRVGSESGPPINDVCMNKTIYIGVVAACLIIGFVAGKWIIK